MKVILIYGWYRQLYDTLTTVWEIIDTHTQMTYETIEKYHRAEKYGRFYSFCWAAIWELAEL